MSRRVGVPEGCYLLETHRTHISTHGRSRGSDSRGLQTCQGTQAQTIAAANVAVATARRRVSCVSSLTYAARYNGHSICQIARCWPRSDFSTNIIYHISRLHFAAHGEMVMHILSSPGCSRTVAPVPQPESRGPAFDFPGPVLCVNRLSESQGSLGNSSLKHSDHDAGVRSVI